MTILVHHGQHSHHDHHDHHGHFGHHGVIMVILRETKRFWESPKESRVGFGEKKSRGVDLGRSD